MTEYRVVVYQNLRGKKDRMDPEEIVLVKRKNKVHAVFEVERDGSAISVFAYGFTSGDTPFMVWGLLDQQTYEKLKRGSEISALLVSPLHPSRNSLVRRVKRRYFPKRDTVLRKIEDVAKRLRTFRIVKAGNSHELTVQDSVAN